MSLYGWSEREISDQDVLFWAKSKIKELENYSYLSYSDRMSLAVARFLIKLKGRAEELEEQLRRTKEELSSTISKKDQEITELRAKVEELEKEVEEHKVKLSNLSEFGLNVKGPDELVGILWSLIKNQGWELFSVVLEGSNYSVVRIKSERGGFYAFRTKGEITFFTETGYEKKLKEKIGYITPLGQLEKEKKKLPKALKDALTRALAQYFELVKVEMKIEIFMTNILPFARLAGIEVGDPNGVKPFDVWVNGEEKIHIYTPEQAYRGWVSALNSKDHVGFVSEGYLSLSAITKTLVEFMNYTIQQIAMRYPEVVSEALNLAARSVGKLPTASLVDLGSGRTLKGEEVKEAD